MTVSTHRHSQGYEDSVRARVDVRVALLVELQEQHRGDDVHERRICRRGGALAYKLVLVLCSESTVVITEAFQQLTWLTN